MRACRTQWAAASGGGDCAAELGARLAAIAQAHPSLQSVSGIPVKPSGELVLRDLGLADLELSFLGHVLVTSDVSQGSARDLRRLAGQ